ncbi:FHA domain-containing protein [Microlunatus sagamiharensis]|uniref:FHA domain-containing protein n=1 Tax=Microlunatus sagamiharensis TaxID=546874 RepID=A0A1H2N7W0_9ACTN|nr:FHA domain-containing protein [Microlunatus sagamiharensis]
MGIFQRFEKSVEGAVNGVFARAFKGDVQPVEIAARLQRELDAEAKLMSRDKRLVPNDFTVELSPHDHDKLAPYASTLTRELADELRSHAGDRGYVFSGPIRIDLALDERLPTGRFTVSSEAVAGVEVPEAPARTPQPEPRPSVSADDREDRDDRRGRTVPPAGRTGRGTTTLVLEVNGMRHPLQAPGLVIGRGTDADLRINDPGISRRHAEIRVDAEGPGSLDIVDLGSTNGITVDGHKVRHATLREGSRIEIGTTRMLVHDPSAR